MGHQHDYWEGWRSWFIPKLGVIAQFLQDVTGDRYYVTSEANRNELVGRVPVQTEEFEEMLHEWGFRRNPLASLKHLSTDEDEWESGSWRKIGYEDHPEMQLHVIYYNGNKIEGAADDHTFIYAHWEVRWDVHPLKHYWGYGFDADEGVRRMKDILDQNGVPYKEVRP